MEKRKRSICITVAAIFLVAAAGIIAIIASGKTQIFDEKLLVQMMDSLMPGGATTIVEGLTYMGNWATITLLALVLLIFPKYRWKLGIPVAAAALIGTALRLVFQLIVQRPRPDMVTPLMDVSGFSCPSAHATVAMAVYGVLALMIFKYTTTEKVKKYAIGVIAVALAFCVGLSRIYIGVHYPSDVLAGWILGVAVIPMAILLQSINFFAKFK